MLIRHLVSVAINNINERFRFHQDVEKAINGGISFGTPIAGIARLGQNIDGVWVLVADTGNANTEFSVTHNLNRIPVGFDVKRINVAASIFDSGTAPTNTKMFFKSNIAHVALTLFIH